MQSITRWKIACMVLAAATGVLAVRAHGTGRNSPASRAEIRSSTIPLVLRRPIRVSAEAVGISERDLIDRILAANSVRDVQMLCEKLGMVGTDEAVDALGGMLVDPRFGVAGAILGAFVAIGTERAIDRVIEAADDTQSPVRSAAIQSLGNSQSERAEQLLLSLVDKAGDPDQETAIAELGNLASERAVAKLVDLANSGDYAIERAAVTALGAASTSASEAALKRLLNASDRRIATAALSAISSVDEEVMAKITEVLHSGTPMLVDAALMALARKGAAALPMIREAALHGGMETRSGAIYAIARVGGDDAIALLGEIMNSGDQRSAREAASQLVNLGGQQARDLLIEAALSDRAQITGALSLLSQLPGEDVDQALLSVIRQGTNEERRAVLPRLLKGGNADAIAVATDLATKGPLDDRRAAIRLLADSKSPQALDTLIQIANTARDRARSEALNALVQSHPTDPIVGRLLSDALASGRRREVVEAADLLGQTGTETARRVLVTALAGKDATAATAAVSALGQLGMTDEVKAAMLSAASSDPDVKMQVMTQLVTAGAPEGLRLAKEMLEGDTDAARQVVGVLSGTGNAEASELVERALESKEPVVRAAALSRVAGDRGEHSIDTLLQFTRDSDSDVRATALRELSYLGSERAQSALLAAARQGSSAERANAVRWLSNIGDSRNSAALASFMRDPDPRVAIAAISDAGVEANSQLVSLIHDPNIANEVKVMAATQLQRDGESPLDPATQAVIDQIEGRSNGSEE